MAACMLILLQDILRNTKVVFCRCFLRFKHTQHQEGLPAEILAKQREPYQQSSSEIESPLVGRVAYELC